MMLRALACISTSSCIAFNALAQPQVNGDAQLSKTELVKRFQFGLPANQVEATKDREEYERQLAFLTSSQALEVNASDLCHAFGNTLTGIHLQIADLLNTLSGKQNLWQNHSLEVARLEILVSFASVFQQQIEDDAEGEAALINIAQKSVCPLVNRTKWKELNSKLYGQMLSATVNTIGLPGSIGMQELENGLAEAVIQKESSDRWKFWATAAVMTVISLAVWYFTPFMAAAIFGGGILAAGRVVMYGFRVAGLSLESMSYNYVDNHFLFTEDTALNSRNPMISWKDFVDRSQEFLETPLNSPRIYYDAIMQLHGSLSSQMINTLSSWRDGKDIHQEVELPRAQ